MSINEKTLKTFSGREYPNGWDRLYGSPMGFWESLLFIIKMSFWPITLKPDRRFSIWLVRIINPFVWFLLYSLGQGSLLPILIVGFIALILSVLSFENTEGMERRLILLWGISVPLVLIISPFIALIIMGGENKEGLGKKTMWNDFTSMDSIRQATSGRNNHNRK